MSNEKKIDEKKMEVKLKRGKVVQLGDLFVSRDYDSSSDRPVSGMGITVRNRDGKKVCFFNEVGARGLADFIKKPLTQTT